MANITPYLAQNWVATAQFKTGVTTLMTLSGDKSGVTPVMPNPTTGTEVIPSQSDTIRRISTEMTDGGSISIPMILGDHNKDLLSRTGETAEIVLSPNGTASGALKATFDLIVTGFPFGAPTSVYPLSMTGDIDGAVTWGTH